MPFAKAFLSFHTRQKKWQKETEKKQQRESKRNRSREESLSQGTLSIRMESKTNTQQVFSYFFFLFFSSLIRFLLLFVKNRVWTVARTPRSVPPFCGKLTVGISDVMNKADMCGQSITRHEPALICSSLVKSERLNHYGFAQRSSNSKQKTYFFRKNIDKRTN